MKPYARYCRLWQSDRHAVIARMEQTGPLPDARRERLLTNDYQALLAAVALPKPGFEADLPNMTMPFLIVMGEADLLSLTRK